MNNRECRERIQTLLDLNSRGCLELKLETEEAEALTQAIKWGEAMEKAERVLPEEKEINKHDNYKYGEALYQPLGRWGYNLCLKEVTPIVAKLIEEGNRVILERKDDMVFYNKKMKDWAEKYSKLQAENKSLRTQLAEYKERLGKFHDENYIGMSAYCELEDRLAERDKIIKILRKDLADNKGMWLEIKGDSPNDSEKLADPRNPNQSGTYLEGDSPKEGDNEEQAT